MWRRSASLWGDLESVVAGMLPRVREESAAKSAVKMASRPVSGRCQGEGQFC